MTSPPRSAIQLYSVESLSSSLPDIVSRAAEAGFEGVEFAHRFRDADPEAVATALAESGVEPVGVHVDLETLEAALDGRNDFLDRCKTVGCDRVIIPHISPRHFRTRESVESLSARLSLIGNALEAHGLDLGYHTTRHDLWPLFPDSVERLLESTPLPDGVVTYAADARSRLRGEASDSITADTGLWNLLAEVTTDDLFIELEVAEVTAAGFDPDDAFGLAVDRVPAIHLCDVAQTGHLAGYEAVPHGEGDVELQAAVDAAADAGVEWVVYENELDIDPETKLESGAALLDRLLPSPAAATGSPGSAREVGTGAGFETVDDG